MPPTPTVRVVVKRLAVMVVLVVTMVTVETVVGRRLARSWWW